jgi:hypothetical protein
VSIDSGLEEVYEKSETKVEEEIIEEKVEELVQEKVEIVQNTTEAKNDSDA